jgi:hypothetical protein
MLSQDYEIFVNGSRKWSLSAVKGKVQKKEKKSIDKSVKMLRKMAERKNGKETKFSHQDVDNKLIDTFRTYNTEADEDAYWRERDTYEMSLEEVSVPCECRRCSFNKLSEEQKLDVAFFDRTYFDLLTKEQQANIEYWDKCDEENQARLEDQARLEEEEEEYDQIERDYEAADAIKRNYRRMSITAVVDHYNRYSSKWSKTIRSEIKHYLGMK